MANRRVLDQDAKQRLRELISLKEPLTVVASELGVSYKAAQNTVRELGLSVETRRPRPSYPPELRQQAVARYVAGQSTGEIARLLRVSDTWVQSQLSNAGIDARASGKVLDRDDDIRERYAAGDSSAQIARDLGVSDVTVLNHLRRMKVSTRPAGWAVRRVPIRHDAFADDLDPRASYWAGFLMADGCVAMTGRVTLVLKAGDEGHIQKWLDFLGSSETPVRIDGRRARAQISSRRIADDLARHGIVPRKTYQGIPTSDVMAASPAFWRGMVDGDGGITWPKGKHGPSLSLCGSHAVMSQFARFLVQNIGGREPRVLDVPRTDVINRVQLEGVRAREAVTLLWEGVLGNGGDAPALARKVPRAITAMGWRTGTELLGE
jgi:transposase-like protein